MMVAAPMSRSLASQLLARSARTLTRPVSNHPFLRVNCNCTTSLNHSSYQYKTEKARTYATAAAKPASRPKQHTGRTSAKRTTTQTKKAAPAKKPAAKAPTEKTTKTVAKKATPRAKKVPSKTALLKKSRTERADLKAVALLEEPKQLPATPFQLILVEETKSAKGSVGQSAKTASSKYKSLTPEQREHYNHEANQNKATNNQAYKRWVQTHSPIEIKLANNARRLLTKRAKAAGQKKHYKPINDDRAVRHPLNSYTYFAIARNESGDLNGMTVSERGKLVGQEWKRLSAAERKPFDDQAQADRNRYQEEYKTVYGEASPSTKVKTPRAPRAPRARKAS